MLTKIDLTQALTENNKEIAVKIKQAISDNNHELLKHLVSKDELYANFATKDDLRESVNTIQITMDKIYGIVKKIDQEQTVMSHQVNNHESRLTKVEAILA